MVKIVGGKCDDGGETVLPALKKIIFELPIFDEQRQLFCKLEVHAIKV
jgi:hypothetical protein